MDDQLQNLRELEHRAADLARRFAAAAASGSGTFTGTDSDEAVEVAIGDDGQAVQVRLSREWRSLIGDTGLGVAVVTAFANAATARLTAWATGMAEQTGTQSAEEDLTPPRAEPGNPVSRQSEFALRDLLDLLHEVDEQMPAAIEGAEAAATGTLSAANPRRTVRVTATAGAVTSVEFDGEWLRSAQHDRIAEAITEALAAVQRLAAEERARAFDGVPAFGRLRRLTESPETLWREIGLIR
ncbi:hypothetical protein [Actinoplanes sp. NPDC026623]|uniref:hypothetical protein n=1 Tax=Actinoplanes sp. NPDC026623 TaxID=3155610 RepID=UPI0033F63BA1